MSTTRRKKQPKADLHLTVNPLLIDYFETLRPIHGREYSEFFEEKLTEFILSIAPEKKLELDLETAEKKVIDLKQAINDVKILKSIELELKKAEVVQNNIQNEEQEELQLLRKKMFVKYKKTLEYQRKNHIAHDWPKLQEDFRFKTRFEVQEYIASVMG